MHSGGTLSLSSKDTANGKQGHVGCSAASVEPWEKGTKSVLLNLLGHTAF